MQEGGGESGGSGVVGGGDDSGRPPTPIIEAAWMREEGDRCNNHLPYFDLRHAMFTYPFLVFLLVFLFLVFLLCWRQTSACSLSVRITSFEEA